MAKTGAVAVKGLRELQRAFATFDDDLVGDIAQELEEAAQPVAKLATQYIVGGGGGFGEMRGIAQSGDASYWSAMRIGVSKRQAQVWVAPAWRSNKGTLQGAILALHFRFRMEGALEDKSKEIEKRLGDVIDNLSRAWARAA